MAAPEPIIPVPHQTARCCWCQGPLYAIGAAYWCRTEVCWQRQVKWAIGTKARKGNGPIEYLYVPTPVQVMFEEARAPYILFGGAAGGAKSHALRWSMYRRAMALPGYEGLLLRRTYPELEKTHLRRMASEVPRLKRAGVAVDFAKSDYLVRFGNGSLIECGHMDDAAAVDKYLSTEYDDIGADEASLFDPEALLSLSGRSVKRTKKPAVVQAGGPWFRAATNPGGRASQLLLDFFIDHAPDFDHYPQLRSRYKPDEWVFIPAKLEDNPYVGDGYEESLAVNSETRYRQLRYGDWRVFAGQFFTSWRPEKDGRPFHVRDLSLGPDSVSWFRSMDWGRSNPGCVLWWACLPDGHYHIAAELKFIDRDIPDVIADIRTIDAELGVRHVRYTVSDPALFNKSQETGESIAETFAKQGVPLTRGNNSRQNGWERCRMLLRADPSGVPYLTVAPRCRYGIRTLPVLQQDEHNPEDVDTTMDDHWADAWRYGAMSRPAPHRFAPPVFAADALGAMADEIRQAASA